MGRCVCGVLPFDETNMHPASTALNARFTEKYQTSALLRTYISPLRPTPSRPREISLTSCETDETQTSACQKYAIPSLVEATRGPKDASRKTPDGRQTAGGFSILLTPRRDQLSLMSFSQTFTEPSRAPNSLRMTTQTTKATAAKTTSVTGKLPAR